MYRRIFSQEIKISITEREKERERERDVHESRVYMAGQAESDDEGYRKISMPLDIYKDAMRKFPNSNYALICSHRDFARRRATPSSFSFRLTN